MKKISKDQDKEVFKERPIMLQKTYPMNLKQQNKKSKKHGHGDGQTIKIKCLRNAREAKQRI